MPPTGKCYCGALHYAAEGAPVLKAQCHCRECQYITGGGPNYFMLMPVGGFTYSKGAPKSFTRPDLDIPVVRVRVPGLACFAVNQRRVGWRCKRHLL